MQQFNEKSDESTRLEMLNGIDSKLQKRKRENKIKKTSPYFIVCLEVIIY